MDDRFARLKCDTTDATSDGTRLPKLDIHSLVVEHQRAVYRYAFRLTGNEADAEDLTQQTFLIAQQRLAQVREPDKAAAWLFAVLRSCYLKSKRKRQPINATGLELDVESIPDTVTEEDIDAEQLQLAINELPDEFKLVLVMFYFEGCSYKEIAAKLEVPIGTVMSRLTRAKGRLRGRLLPRTADRDDELARRPASSARSAPSFAMGMRKHQRQVGR
jgi:RNA polymerase sigma-70 factor (ECF subfamily)